MFFVSTTRDGSTGRPTVAIDANDLGPPESDHASAAGSAYPDGRVTAPFTLRIARTDLLVLAAFAAYAALLFRLTLFEGWTFIGDSDRVNDYLSVRVFEMLTIQQHGFPSTWSDQQFMGFSAAGLHWMLPGASPIPYILALLPGADTFWAINLFTIALFVSATWFAYLSLRAYSAALLPAAVGALLYSTSSYALLRLAQIDASFSILAIVPLLLVGIREARRATALPLYLLLTVCWACLFLFTFLQEVAYIALVFGLYTVFRSIRLHDPYPLVVSGLAFVGGVALGLPRLLTVATDFQELARSSVDFTWLVGEALRFFGDGLLAGFKP
jgi:hypothetical protein